MKVINITILLLMLINFSCEEVVITDCEDCSLSEPINAILSINISPSAFGYSEAVEIKIYEGELEDNILFKTIVTYNKEVTTDVRINKTYTVTALYKMENADYLAVDSAFPRVRYDKDQCDSPCYFVYDKTLNLRLKYN